MSAVLRLWDPIPCIWRIKGAEPLGGVCVWYKGNGQMFYMETMLLSMPNDLREEVLMRVDAPTVASWARVCRASAASVRVAYGAALAGLKGDGRGGGWMFACLADARRRRCAEVGATDLDWADAVDVFASEPEPDALSLPAGPSSSFIVHVDTSDPLLVRRCLGRVASLGPRRVHITPSGGVEGACRALRDCHLEAMKGVEQVAIPGNLAVTDAGLEHLAACRVVWLGGCTGVRGDGLADLVHRRGCIRLLSVKWRVGWGSRWPFTERVMSWLAAQEAAGLVIG